MNKFIDAAELRKIEKIFRSQQLADMNDHELVRLGRKYLVVIISVNERNSEFISGAIETITDLFYQYLAGKIQSNDSYRREFEQELKNLDQLIIAHREANQQLIENVKAAIGTFLQRLKKHQDYVAKNAHAQGGGNPRYDGYYLEHSKVIAKAFVALEHCDVIVKGFPHQKVGKISDYEFVTLIQRTLKKFNTNGVLAEIEQELGELIKALVDYSDNFYNDYSIVPLEKELREYERRTENSLTQLTKLIKTQRKFVDSLYEYIDGVKTEFLRRFNRQLENRYTEYSSSTNVSEIQLELV